jgi:hypothetical protein
MKNSIFFYICHCIHHANDRKQGLSLLENNRISWFSCSQRFLNYLALSVSKMDNPGKLGCTRRRKTEQNTIQYVLDITIRKQTQITQIRNGSPDAAKVPTIPTHAPVW